MCPRPSCPSTPRADVLEDPSLSQSSARRAGSQVRVLAVDLELQVLVIPVVDRPGVAQPQELRGLRLPDGSPHIPRDGAAPRRLVALALLELAQLGQPIGHRVAIPVDRDRALLLAAELVEPREPGSERRLAGLLRL